MKIINEIIEDITEVRKLHEDNIFVYYSKDTAAYDKRKTYDEWHYAKSRLIDTLEEKLPDLIAEAEATESIIQELVNELLPHNTDHQKLIYKALKSCGFTDNQIKLWFAGEILF